MIRLYLGPAQLIMIDARGGGWGSQDAGEINCISWSVFTVYAGVRYMSGGNARGAGVAIRGHAIFVLIGSRPAGHRRYRLCPRMSRGGSVCRRIIHFMDKSTSSQVFTEPP